MLKFRQMFGRKTLREDAVAGLVLGVESVPDGLAGGLLAGVNPVYGLYAYMTGTLSGALFTSSSFMAVQATGAMAIVVADVSAVHSGDDPDRALFTLAVLTGGVMLVAGLLKLGSLLRFVSNAVMVGFINAVGVNIILGQLDNFTGYEASGGNRVVRAFDLVFNFWEVHFPTLVVGVVTIALILLLEKTRLGPLGMVVAIVIGSAIVPLVGWEVMQLNDIADIPGTLPLPVLPDFGLTVELILPAVALAFVGLVQGAGISANFPNPDGIYPEPSQDFVGQGAANVVAGVFQGMPVGGSMSASSLVKNAGAKSRTALVLASVVMAIVILAFGGLVGFIAMPALAGLLIIVGYRTIKPHEIFAVWRTGLTQAVVLSVTFVLTMVIPLQTAVLVGVGISVILFTIDRSNEIVVRRWRIDKDKNVVEEEPPEALPSNEVVAIQPYGSLFFAAAPLFEERLPEVTSESVNSVVLIRLRGRSDVGTTFTDVLLRYADSLKGVDSKLMIVSTVDPLYEQLRVTGVVEIVGEENIYATEKKLGAAMKRAYSDAHDWITARSSANEDEETPDG